VWSEFIARFYFCLAELACCCNGAAQAGKVLRIVADGSKLIQAVANCTVPKISIVAVVMVLVTTQCVVGVYRQILFLLGRTRMLL
jgi:hypothetical protein